MRKHLGILSLLLMTGILASADGAAASQVEASLVSPEEHFGFRPGADRKLIDYGELVEYLQLAAARSPRVELRRIGRSELGRDLYVAFLSSAANLERLEELRGINRSLALDPDLSDLEREALLERGRVFVLATLSMHASEVGPAQALPLLVHELASTADPGVVAQLEDVVLMVVPTHNPDGMDMVVEHYRSTLGTAWEGSPLPGVYNRYVGHDNNRDYVNLTQSESRAVSALTSTDWFPQVHVDKHQMGSTGPRYYVPNVHDPISENLDEGIWTWAGVFGSNMANDMGRDGQRGVATHWLFDFYWPGPTETAAWKNVISFLTEAASCRLATPVRIEPTELEVHGKGLSEYAKSINMPDPWPGGWWRLSDIVGYELTTMRSILATAARHRREILQFRNDLCRSEVAKGRTEPPFYYVFPRRQHDPGALADLVALLQEHGVQVAVAGADLELEGRVVSRGDVVVPLAQPFRAFVKEVLERQRYPVRHYTPDGEVIRPYDVTTWSLPLHRGLACQEVDVLSTELESALAPVEPAEIAPPITLAPDSWGVALTPAANASYRVVFAALAAGATVERALESFEIDGTELAAGTFVLEAAAARSVASPLPAGAVALERRPDAPLRTLRAPRIGLVETSFHDMDAGWTRWLFDSFAVAHQVLRPGDFESTDLAASFDVLVFPDVDADILTKGKRRGRDDRYRPPDYPPRFTRPISEKGIANLRDFIAGGGVVASWLSSTELFLEALDTPDAGDVKDDDSLAPLPARDVSESLEAKGLFVPGSLLRARVVPEHPLTWGVPNEVGVFSVGSPVFATSIPRADSDRRVIAVHPARDVLLSGYIEGEEQLAGKPAMVWLKSARGQLVLFGFGPQFRASTPATYKLLFNALLLPPIPS